MLRIQDITTCMKAEKARKTMTVKLGAARVSEESSTASGGSAALRWTTRKPKRPGWWWLAAPTGYTPRIVKVWQNEDGKLIVDAESNGWPLARPYRAGNTWKGCRWYGPLVAPDRPWIAATPPNEKVSDDR